MNFKILSAPSNIETVERFVNSPSLMEIFILTTPRQEKKLGMKNDGTKVSRKRLIKVRVSKCVPARSSGYTFIGTIQGGLGASEGGNFIANISPKDGEVTGTLSTSHTRVNRRLYSCY